MLNINRQPIRSTLVVFFIVLCVVFSSAFGAPQSNATLIQLSNDNNIAAGYNSTWQQGDIVGAILTPQNSQYPVRVSSIEFVLDNRFSGAGNTTTVRGCIYALSNGLPGRSLGCSAPTEIKTFFPNFVSLSLESYGIVINTPDSFMATVEYLAGAPGKTPSIVTDSNAGIPHGKNYYSEDGGHTWLEQYDFWLQPEQTGFNIIRATVETHYGSPTKTPTRLLAPTRTPTPIIAPTITPTALPPVTKLVCPAVSVSNSAYLPFITKSGQNDESNNPNLPADARLLGLKNYWSYAAMTIADHELLVNLANGNLLLDTIDQYLPAPGIDNVVGRTYNTLSHYRGEFGSGWTSNIGNFARLEPQNNGNVILYRSSGAIELFTASGGSLIAPPGFHYTLDQRPDSSYVLTSIGDGLQYNFNKQGALHSINDRNGNVQLYQRNARNATNTIIDSVGQSTTIDYNELSLVSHITDWTGRIYQYRYDVSGRLTQYVDPAGHTTEYHYDNCGRLTQLVDAGGNHWTIDYDDQGRAVLVADPLGNKTEFTYQTAQTIVTDANGHNTIYQVDADGKLQKSIDANGHSTLITWDQFANETSVTSPLSHTVQLGWDGNTGLLTTEEDASGNRVAYRYDSNYNLIAMTDAKGNVTRFAYDATGANVLRINQPDGNAISFTYDKRGNLLTATDPNGNAHDPSNPLGLSYRFQYNDFGYLTDGYDPLNNHWTYAWDNATGNLLSMRDAKGQRTEYTYDALDRLTNLSYADGKTVSFRYDALNNLVTMTDGQGATNYTYDAVGQLLTEANPLVSGLTQYAYDAVGNLTRVTRENGAILTLNYDPGDRLISQSNPFDKNRLITYHYDPDDRLTDIRYPNGDQTTYSYHPNDWLKSLLTTGGDSTVYGQYDYPSQSEGGYDANGNPLKFTRTFARFDEQGQLNWRTETWQMAYDAMDRLTQQESYDASGAWQYQVGLNYNPNGLWSTRTYRDNTQSQSWTYNYDAAARWTGVAYWDGRHDVVVNDANGNQTQIIEEFFTAAGAARPNSSPGLAQGIIPYSHFGLTPDQQTGALRSLAATTTHTTTFEYDAADRLHKVTDPAGNWYTFQYDGFDRMIELNSSHYALPKQQYYDALGMERETQGAMSANYLYDLAGNVRANALEGAPSQYLHRDPRGQITHVSDDLMASLDYCFMGNIQESGVAVDENVYEPLLSTGKYAVSLDGTWQAGAMYSNGRGQFSLHNSQLDLQNQFAAASTKNDVPNVKKDKLDHFNEDPDEPCGPGDSWWKCFFKRLMRWFKRGLPSRAWIIKISKTGKINIFSAKHPQPIGYWNWFPVKGDKHSHRVLVYTGKDADEYGYGNWDYEYWRNPNGKTIIQNGRFKDLP